MKTVVVVVSGAAGPPAGALADRTALQAARAHHATTLALRGSSGWIDGADWAYRRPLGCLAVCLGVDRDHAEAWRSGPVEAAGVDWEVPPGSRIYHGTLVTLEGDRVCDRLAGKATLAETKALAESIADALAVDGVDCRATGAGVMAFALAGPEGETAARIDALTARAGEVLSGHGVNSVRVDLGENPANGLVLSDDGPVARPVGAPLVAPSAGAAPGDRPLVAILGGAPEGRGLAALTDAEFYSLDDVWGDERHPWRIRPELIEGFRHWRHMVVDLRVPAPAGDMVSVVRAVDFLDQVVLGPLFAVLEAFRPVRILLVAAAEEGAARFPVVLAGDGIPGDGVGRWDEDACVEGGLGGMTLARLITEMMETHQEPWP